MSVRTFPSVPGSTQTKKESRASFRSTDNFEDLPLAAATKRAIREVFGYERLSIQQARYMSLMMRPDSPDVFVKAGTGSGKTLGFLLPAVEALLHGSGSRSRSVSTGTRVLILSPTRELAAQTAAEATRLLTFHTDLKAGAITGGTDRGKDLRMMTKSPPDILVATPGRLQDLIETDPRLLARVRFVVLDEADRLLDPGFAPAVRRILAALPTAPAARATCRTLLLTATVPPEVQGVARTFMREGYEYVDASSGSGSKAAGPANVGVLQRAILAEPTCVHVELARTLFAHHAVVGDKAKALVFFGSIALAELFASLFRSHSNPAWSSLLELHGGLAQNKRTRAMDDFKTRKSAVMFASDAAGRGIDIPNVTLVVQIGCAPADVYQQRVGRTGRAGAKGEAVILLGKDEAKCLGTIKVVAPGIVVSDAVPVTHEEHASLKMKDSERPLADRAFRGTLGAYKANARVLGWSSQDLVDAVAARVLGMGLTTVPEVAQKTLGKMGLKNVSFDTPAIVARLRSPLLLTN